MPSPFPGMAPWLEKPARWLNVHNRFVTYLYRRTHRDILGTDCNLVEIDLLRAGPRNLMAPRESMTKLPAHDYLVCVQRARDRERFDLYPVRLAQRLPRVAVPLREDEPDIVADLRTVLDQVYDRGAFARTLDYEDPPPPPALSAEDAAWADDVLRAKGRRPRRS